MAEYVATNRKLFFGGYDLSGDSVSLNLGVSADALDATVFGLTTRKNIGGLQSVEANVEGLWKGGDAANDNALFSNIGVSNVPVVFGPVDGAEGSVAYFFKAMHANYDVGGPIGEILKFSFASHAQAELLRGIFLANKSAAAATANSTGIQHGAVSATQKLYAALHVFAASGTAPTLDCIIQSAATDFAGPTSRITFAQKTALGSEYATPVAGAITDTWWRVSFTIGGTTPSFDFAVVMSIQ